MAPPQSSRRGGSQDDQRVQVQRTSAGVMARMHGAVPEKRFSWTPRPSSIRSACRSGRIPSPRRFSPKIHQKISTLVDRRPLSTTPTVTGRPLHSLYTVLALVSHTLVTCIVTCIVT